MRQVDYLPADEKISGQEWFLVSHAKLPNGQWFMKLGGVFDTLERAERVAKQKIKRDDNFNIAAGEVGKWLPAIPETENCDRTEYTDERLNELFKGYRESQIAARDHFEERKQNVMRDGLAAHLEEDEIIPKGGPGPPKPMDERSLRQLADAECVHPAERAAIGLPAREDSTIDLPLTRSSAWKVAGS